MHTTGRLLCPSCQELLFPVDRDGVEIDYCPHCRGVWLDRGELEKILERASLAAPRRTNSAPRHGEWDRDYEHRLPRKRKRLRSFLEEIFDFD